ncbi:kinase-like domain-containing protein [Rhizophagus clarus]|uniref:Kinase-like domain-containing protein n=1 Tax=Rhizophagus clarus TaxID=94130 RepID=A0A8H3KYQ7_9GLOM|nr:kinase-like domain-containing protein [Rhizophagus clarus]
MSLQCERCGNEYTYDVVKWCKPCQIDYLKKNFIKESGNRQIDKIIREMQLKIDTCHDIVFEWIPYDEFNYIKEIRRDNCITIYSATRKSNPLYYDTDENKYLRNHFDQDKKVILKYFHSSHITINEFLNKINKYSIKHQDDIRKIYGISQNPYTSDYIMVLEDGEDSYCEECDENYIKEINRDDYITVYSATWKSQPLYYDEDENEYLRDQFDQNKKVNLKYFHSTHITTNEFLKKINVYSIKQQQDDVRNIYGISQNPYTHDYIIVREDSKDDYCEECDKNYIKEINRDNITVVYSATWKSYPLYYDEDKSEYMRSQFGQNKKVTLKYFHNTHVATNGFLNKVNAYSIKRQDDIRNIYGISQNPYTNDYIMVLEDGKDYYCEKCDEKYTDINHKWCKTCQINYLKRNFINWTSGNEKIDESIQEMQSRIGSCNDIVLEWIPYDRFYNIKEVGKYDNVTVHSAIWKGSSQSSYNENILNSQKESQNKKVALKWLCNHHHIDFYTILCKINSYSIKYQNNIRKIYGISQNPYTSDYIMVLEDGKGYYCEKCDEKFTDKNHKWLFEWIPYDQFYNIKETEKYGHITVRSAIWKGGLLCHNNRKVILKFLCNSQYLTYKVLNEINVYSIKYQDDTRKIYGISQDPDTNDYIIALEDGYCEKCDERHDENNEWYRSCQINYLKRNFTNWTSGDERIDKFIQEMQLKIDSNDDIIFEWIPYKKFNDIKEISKDDNITLYSAIWEGGQLFHDKNINDQEIQNNKVILKHFHNSRIISDEFLNKVNSYSIKYQDDIRKIYGMSQNPRSKDYIIALEDGYCEECDKKYDENHIWYKSCQVNYLKTNFISWTSEDEKIDEFIQKMQLKTDYCNGIIFEWIPYNQFNDIKEIVDDHAKVYSAVWKDGPLYYYDDIMEWTKKRSVNTKVILRHLNNLQDIDNEFLNEYNTSYGISQDPNTKNYIMIQDEYCKKCGEKYVSAIHSLYNPCKVIRLRKSFRNEAIDDFIRKAQLNNYFNNTFEWIPFDQFNDIQEIGKGGFATVYSAVWKDGPLYYDNNKKKWLRRFGANKKVVLKCLHNSQNITDKFLDEIKVHSMKTSIYILSMYGISQNPDSKDYIMVLDYVEGGDLYKWLIKNYDKFDWSYKLLSLWNTVRGLKEIHQKLMVHRDLHTGNILVKNEYWPYISDIGLCGKVVDIDETKVFGVMPYVAPEVLKGGKYTQAADIYSLGMLMYFIATGKQPFYSRAHDQYLAIGICKGVRPEMDDLEAPKFYTDLMKRCWDSNPDNRPDINEIFELMKLFNNSKQQQDNEIGKQLEEAEEYRKANPLSIDVIQASTHPQAVYTSRLLNPFTKDLSDNI